jgi:hypothetical protein
MERTMTEAVAMRAKERSMDIVRPSVQTVQRKSQMFQTLCNTRVVAKSRRGREHRTNIINSIINK